MKYATIGPISVHFPERIETNAQLQAEFPKWDMSLIEEKTGIAARRIAAEGECASDLGVAACEKLFKEHHIDRSTIDFILLCTQTPDYPLPTTACLMQHRLGLPTSAGALDFNLGCSGFVYGLSLADGLIKSGAAKRVLLVTAETYSKYIAQDDRSLRTIFGDAAAATLVEASDEETMGGFVFGTDGEAADALIVRTGGARPIEQAISPRKKHRWASALYMDGPALVTITLERIPSMIDRVLELSNTRREQIDLYLMHQATQLMLDRLRERLQISEAAMPLAMRDYGNTVSSTIPILIHDLRKAGKLKPGVRSVLVGYGVGFSWAGCCWTETLAPLEVKSHGESGHAAGNGAAASASLARAKA